MDDLFKAVADPTRRRLLELLAEASPRTLGELCAHLDMTRQGVSQHLAILEASRLLVPVWRGREKLHYLNSLPLAEVYQGWIARLVGGRGGEPAPARRPPGLAARLGRP